jgi:hypothetical protein
VLPETLDRIEVRAVGRQVERLDMMPVELLGFVPAGIVEHEIDRFTASWSDPLGHGIKKDLEDFRIAVGHDQTHQLRD